jgi:hypothetical protein
MVVVGVSNMWAQSGMRARDLAILAGALAVYDFIATAQLPLMADLVGRVAELPFSPLVGWPSSTPGMWAAIGLGDLLLASAFPLVMRKTFGHGAGLVALVASLAALAALFALSLKGLFPVMVVLGPLMVAQYLFWRHNRGRERTTREYLQAEPRGGRALSGQGDQVGRRSPREASNSVNGSADSEAKNGETRPSESPQTTNMSVVSDVERRVRHSPSRREN